jgi:hypothetical protein
MGGCWDVVIYLLLSKKIISDSRSGILRELVCEMCLIGYNTTVILMRLVWNLRVYLVLYLRGSKPHLGFRRIKLGLIL